MPKMDLIDKKILCELDTNCRTPLSQLASKLRIGRNVAAYRINRMEESGIIQKYICSINLGKLGYRTYRIYFKIGVKESYKFVQSMLNSSKVIHCIKTEGAFDYSVTIAVKSIVELDDFLMEVKSKFSDIIRDYAISIVVYSKIFKLNKLLLGTKEVLPKIEKYSGEEEKEEIDSADRMILKVLSQDANLQITEIAKRSGLSIDIVKYRLKSFDRVVSSYRAIMDLNKLGYYHYVIMLKIKRASKSDESRLVSWCSLKNNVLYSVKRIGAHDFEVNVAIRSIEELNAVISDIKEEFGEVIDSYDVMLYSEMLKLNYVPF